MVSFPSYVGDWIEPGLLGLYGKCLYLLSHLTSLKC